jgi:predicted DNA-binding transcriptional regulator YafY
LSGVGDGDSGALLTAACQQYAGQNDTEMRRTSRLFEIIQLLRSARKPLTAAALAETLEVTKRTVYRDVASLQAMSVPIYGEAGVGYVMRPGYDLPPLMLSVEEVEALVVALSLLGRTGDKGLKAAAETIRAKVASVLPHSSKQPIDNVSLYAPAWGAAEPEDLDLSLVRRAIREERKLVISYCDEQGRASERVICPLAIVYFVEVINVAGWCELRQAFRHFRADRIRTCSLSGGRFEGQSAELRARWLAERQSCREPARAASRPEQPFFSARL